MPYKIEPIQKWHDRASFDCGQPFLNDYLQQFARQNHEKGIARAFVMVPEERGNPVVGYYTISASAQAFESIPDQLRKNLPKYPVPVARIGELAVDKSLQGKGLGDALLISALTRIVSAAEKMAVWAIIVDPIDQVAASYYQGHGFEPLLDCNSLFLTMKDTLAWIGEDNKMHSPR